MKFSRVWRAAVLAMLSVVVHATVALAAVDLSAPAAELCTEELTATDANIFGFVLSSEAQRLAAFAGLFATLLGALIYSRAQVGLLSSYLESEKPSGAGRPTESFAGLKKSLATWGDRWWEANKRPLALVSRAILSGYVLPLIVFGITALYFSWLFPGATLLSPGPASIDPCAGRARTVVSFLWEQFYGGASFGIPEVTRGGSARASLVAPNQTAVGFVVAFRLFVMWAGSFSFAQMVWKIAYNRTENFARGVWIRVSKFVRRRFRRPASQSA